MLIFCIIIIYKVYFFVIIEGSGQEDGASGSGESLEQGKVQPRTASIRQRPTSSRITAAELESLFQRQTGVCNYMMTTSNFQVNLLIHF